MRWQVEDQFSRRAVSVFVFPAPLVLDGADYWKHHEPGSGYNLVDLTAIASGDSNHKHQLLRLQFWRSLPHRAAKNATVDLVHAATCTSSGWAEKVAWPDWTLSVRETLNKTDDITAEALFTKQIAPNTSDIRGS